MSATDTCPACKRPLPRPAGRPRTELDTAEVRRALAECPSQRQAALALGVSESTLRAWLARSGSR